LNEEKEKNSPVSGKKAVKAGSKKQAAEKLVEKPGRGNRPVGEKAQKQGEKTVAKQGKQPLKKQEKAAASKPADEKAGKQAGKQGKKLPVDKKLIAVVAAAAVVVVAAFLALQPPRADVSDFWSWGNDQGEDTVKMIIIYSDRCPKCEINNSLEIMFIENGIPYSINKFEEKSPEAQKIIKGLGLIKLPAYLIDDRSIKDEWQVKTKSGLASLHDTLAFYVNEGKATFGEGIFVFYELSLDNRFHVNMLLSEPCGSPGHVLVTHFADTYDPATIATSADMETLRKMFRDYNVEFIYGYLPTVSPSMEAMFTKETIETAPKHLSCASKQGYKEFTDLEQAFYKKYCDVNANSYHEKLFKCHDSNHFGTPLLGEEVLYIKNRLNIGGLEYDACIYRYKDMFAATKALAEKWQIYKTPTVVVNCTYETHPGLARTVICSYIGDAVICR